MSDATRGSGTTSAAGDGDVDTGGTGSNRAEADGFRRNGITRASGEALAGRPVASAPSELGDQGAPDVGAFRPGSGGP
ncbi:hypothetical protein Xph01_39390 [Micromonospora phaseoli]|nr:hypothetical protein [Micromonospora phaseoli]GIJ79507.1 hypothetical protein Xph01_39390 [Micromonospora phaseoli]